MGNPTLTAGEQLTIPLALAYTTYFSASASPSYTVQAGDTWSSITQSIYGTSDANAVAALQDDLGDPTLTAGTQLTELPSTLTYSPTDATTVVPAYIVQPGDTWDSIATKLYFDSSGASQLATDLGNPPLVAGTALTQLPQVLTYISTETAYGFPQTSYTVKAGDTWASITQTLYGSSDPNLISEVQNYFGNETPTVGTVLSALRHLSNSPASATTMSFMPTSTSTR